MQRIVTILFFLSITLFASAQNEYQVYKDSVTGQKIFRGIFSKNILESEESFSWMKTSPYGYTPDTNTINLLRKNQDSIHLLIFMGTWCEDSQQIIPKFFQLLHTSNFLDEKISLIGVDRKKKTSGYLSDALNITRVPTILVMKNGKELGRIIEYGRYGNIEKDLTEILNNK